jgi:hypothetical protein
MGNGASSSSGVGIDAGQLGERSLMRLERFNVVKPRAANTSLIVASVDPSGVAVGAALTIAFPSKLRNARRITLSVDDDDGGGGLSVTVVVTGMRFGVRIVEELTATATSGTILTVTSNKYFDQVTSAVLKSKTAADAGDAITMGIAGVGFGLPYPIDKVSDVLMIARNTSGTEGLIAVSSSTVDVENSAIIGLTLAAADDYEVEFLRSRESDGFGRTGVFP